MDEASNLIWIDCEMTGLDVASNRILEIAIVITDRQLSVIAQTESYVLHQPKKLLDSMDEWNTKTHKASGLYDLALESTLTEDALEKELLSWLQGYCKPKSSALCGNTVHQDRWFLKSYMPKLEEFFHYRHIDVSTIKELAKRWNPSLVENFKKKEGHRALDDILESIEELKYYKKFFFNI